MPAACLYVLLLFIAFAALISYCTGSLACRLTGSLAFAAAFKFDGVLQRRAVNRNDVFRHDFTSRNNLYFDYNSTENAESTIYNFDFP